MGIGRKEASEISSVGNGKGLIVTQRILEILTKLKRVKISYEIIDLYMEEVAIGTRVIIKIPKDSI